MGREVEKQRRKHEMELKAKDSQIEAEKREKTELRLGEAMKIVNSPMVRGISGLFAQSLDEERILR